MKVAVLGCNGMLGTDLVAACRTAGIETLGLDLLGFDITKFESVRANLPEVDRVVNCAAYTRVDDAESQRDLPRTVWNWPRLFLLGLIRFYRITCSTAARARSIPKTIPSTR